MMHPPVSETAEQRHGKKLATKMIHTLGVDGYCKRLEAKEDAAVETAHHDLGNFAENVAKDSFDTLRIGTLWSSGIGNGKKLVCPSCGPSHKGYWKDGQWFCNACDNPLSEVR